MDEPTPKALPNLRSDIGFTLVEVLVATVLLTIGLLGMVALTTGIISGNSHSSQLTTATILAQDKLEESIRKGYFNMPSSDTTTTEDYGSISGYSLFKRSTLTDVENPYTYLKTVTITVYWNSDGRSVSFDTILAR